MAVTTVGFAGPDVRSDVRVTLTDSNDGKIVVSSSVEALYGDSIRDQVRAKLSQVGSPRVDVFIEDSGALPYVIDARLEAAMSQHLAQPLLPISPRDSVVRAHRPRRSRLYVPGNSPKLHPNVGLYGADCVIFDLEDSVAATEKETARALVRQTLIHVDLGQSESVVRINSGSLGHQDVEALVPAGPSVFLVPKANSPEILAALSTQLDQLGSRALLIAIVESAKGVANANETAKSTPRLVAMTLGIEDYLADIHATDKGAADWANGMILNASRAAGISPLASVTSVIHDDNQVEEFARKMASYGFEGVGCIHPRQVGPAHRGFAPTEEELLFAIQVVEQYEAATAAGQGVIAVDGRMVDEPVYLRAKRTVAYR